MCTETPLAYWSGVPINEDNFPHAHTCPKSAHCGGPTVAAERIALTLTDELADAS